MLHKYDCEVYTLADVLQDFLKYEETIDDYDTRKHFGILVDDLIAAVADVNDRVTDAEEESRAAMYYQEEYLSQLEDAQDIIKELQDEIQSVNEDAEMMVKFRKVMRGEL